MITFLTNTNSLRKSLIPVLLVLSLTTPGVARAETPNVVVSLKSLHSLVSAIMSGVGTPLLLLDRPVSPHAARLRPSQARAIARADLVVWIGGPMETFMRPSMANRKQADGAVTVLALPDLQKHAPRAGGVWEEHEQDHDHGHGHGHDGKEGTVDPHVWLSTTNAAVIADGVMSALIRIDPSQAATYQANRKALQFRLDALTTELGQLLGPVANNRYVALHDAFQYFEKQFGLSPLGALSPTAGTSPGARRISDLRAQMSQHKVRCVASDPFAASAYIKTLQDGTDARVVALHPDGMNLAQGPDQFAAMMRQNASALASCLAVR